MGHLEPSIPLSIYTILEPLTAIPDTISIGPRNTHRTVEKSVGTELLHSYVLGLLFSFEMPACLQRDSHYRSNAVL